MDHPKPSRNLSEISHLFLSSIRDRQTGGMARPQRKPPQPSHSKLSVDLTPEEFAQVFGEPAELVASSSPQRLPPLSAVVAAHLNGSQMDRVREYARHLAAQGQRIGLIEVDEQELRLVCFDRAENVMGGDGDAESPQTADPREVAQAINELNWDLDRWLVVLTNPRLPEARSILRDVRNWVLLATSDHDGVVSCYRTVKGLSDDQRPRLSLAVLDAENELQAGRTFRKLAGVCQQFLGWPVYHESPVHKARDVAQNVVMSYCPASEAGSALGAAAWQMVHDLCRQALQAHGEKEQQTPAAQPVSPVTAAPQAQEAEEPQRQAVGELVVPAFEAPDSEPEVAAPAAEPQVAAAPAPVSVASPAPAPAVGLPPVSLCKSSEESTHSLPEVIDLAEGHDEKGEICSAVLRQAAGELAECSLRPPMCPEARLAISREHRIVLLAVAKQGLGDLRAIAQAYHWLMENRILLAMALSQFAIDAHQVPQLRLLVDQADLSAALLRPMLQSSNVTVHAYRKLRWGGKTGLLLDAA